jgi:cobaltochelatase CobN
MYAAIAPAAGEVSEPLIEALAGLAPEGKTFAFADDVNINMLVPAGKPGVSVAQRRNEILEAAGLKATETGAVLFILPGDDQNDPQLMSHSTIPLEKVTQLWRYFVEGGQFNLLNMLKFLADCCFKTNYHPPLAQTIPKIGLYKNLTSGNFPVGILFYRSHYLSGNLAPINALIQALQNRHLSFVAVYVSSLRDPDVQTELLSLFANIQLILNTTSFSIAQLGLEETNPLLWKKLNVPIHPVLTHFQF